MNSFPDETLASMRASTSPPPLMRREMARIKLDDVTQVIELKVRVKQNTLFAFKISLSFPPKEAALLGRGAYITIITSVGRISDQIIRWQFKLNIPRLRDAGLTDSRGAGPESRPLARSGTRSAAHQGEIDVYAR